MRVTVSVNGVDHELDLEPRELLVDVLRDDLGLTGVHAACDQGACGSCTVLVDGSGVRSCLMFGVQAAGREVTTIEGVGAPGDLHPIQRALSEHHGLQCGYCTPGVVLTALELLRDTPEPTAEEIDAGMSGSLCRCTGYTSIVDAIAAVAASGRGGQ
jgi:carbon-monoxide dehydrogenase small subunit